MYVCREDKQRKRHIYTLSQNLSEKTEGDELEEAKARSGMQDRRSTASRSEYLGVR